MCCIGRGRVHPSVNPTHVPCQHVLITYFARVQSLTSLWSDGVRCSCVHVHVHGHAHVHVHVRERKVR